MDQDLPIVIVPYRQDNYGFLIHNPTQGLTLAIDAGDDRAYLNALDQQGWSLTHILITHHDDDHTSHIQALKNATGAQALGPQGIGGIDTVIGAGDLPDLGVRVLETPGHTLDMLNFYIPAAGAVFTGDTLFTLGCGRLTEGTPALMWASLQTLKALPPDTRVYGAHEYTLASLDFALSQLPNHAPLIAQAQEIRALRAAGKPAVPSRLRDELINNPFLRATRMEEFAQLRAAKDVF